ncbi:MAG: hypothetical protein ACREE9_21690 [Stellaceae bacterium]
MISVSSIVRWAASWAAATTKSLTLRPWISAARLTTASASGAGVEIDLHDVAVSADRHDLPAVVATAASTIESSLVGQTSWACIQRCQWIQ